jgi:hypothetical protein
MPNTIAYMISSTALRRYTSIVGVRPPLWQRRREALASQALSTVLQHSVIIARCKLLQTRSKDGIRADSESHHRIPASRYFFLVLLPPLEGRADAFLLRVSSNLNLQQAAMKAEQRVVRFSHIDEEFHKGRSHMVVQA